MWQLKVKEDSFGLTDRGSGNAFSITKLQGTVNGTCKSSLQYTTVTLNRRALQNSTAPRVHLVLTEAYVSCGVPRAYGSCPSLLWCTMCSVPGVSASAPGVCLQTCRMATTWPCGTRCPCLRMMWRAPSPFWGIPSQRSSPFAGSSARLWSPRPLLLPLALSQPLGRRLRGPKVGPWRRRGWQHEMTV